MELKELIEKVRAATGPDRDIDASIAKALRFTSGDGPFGIGRGDDWPEHEYTASIDAALALVDRCLPGWVVSDLCQNSRHAGDPWGCELAIYYGSNPSKNRSSFSGYDFPTAPLAIILALLTALDQKEENK